MDRLNVLLPKVLKRRGMYDSAIASLVVNKANAWLIARFSTSAEAITAHKLSDSVLTITANNSALLMEAEQEKSTLMAYLQAEIPDAVKAIKLVRM